MKLTILSALLLLIISCNNDKKNVAIVEADSTIGMVGFNYKYSEFVVQGDSYLAEYDYEGNWKIEGDTVAAMTKMADFIKEYAKQVVMITTNKDTLYYSAGDTIRITSCKNNQ